MLRKLLPLLSLVVSLTAHAQIANTPSKTTEKPVDTQIDYKKAGAPMPQIRLIVCRDSIAGEKPKKAEVLTNDDLDNGANSFIMIFNPTCSHCQDETAMIEEHIDLFTRSKLVLSATPVMKPYVADFLKLLKIKDYPQITVGVDSAGYMDKVFKYGMLPQINIYNKKHKLIKIYNGDVAIDSLKEYIQ